MTEPGKLKEELKRYALDLAEVQRQRQALDRRERALEKVVAGITELISETAPGEEQTVLEPVQAFIKNLRNVEELRRQAVAETTTLNDAVEAALRAVGISGASLEELWEFAKERGAKTTIDPHRATTFALSNLRKRGVNIVRGHDGLYRLGEFSRLPNQ